MNTAILTRSQAYVDLIDPKPTQIILADLVHGLAHCGRYANQSPRLMRVAEHSWLVAADLLQFHGDLRDEDPAAFRALQLRALLHDGSEAYMIDMPAPLKHHPSMDGYRRAEARMQAVIFERFGLPAHDPSADAMIDRVDKGIRKEEIDVLWGRCPPATRPNGTWGVRGLEPEAARLGFQFAFDAIYFADPSSRSAEYQPFSGVDERVFDVVS